MALQTSGPISFADIAAEYGLSLPKSLKELSNATGVGSEPYSMADFLGVTAPAPSGGTLQATLSASDKEVNDFLGTSVALSVDGNTMVVGALTGDASVNDSGAAYVFVRSGTSWTEQAKLTPSQSAAGNEFGISASISSDGNTVIIGARRSDDVGTDSGSAYVFVRSGTSWSEQAKLVSSDLASGDEFGQVVSISDDGDYAVVSAVGADVSGVTDAGAVYVFTRSGTSWTQQAKLTADIPEVDDGLGGGLDISGDSKYIVAGAGARNSLKGVVYVYERTGTSWSQQAKIEAADGVADDKFGGRALLSVDGTTLAVSADNADVGGTPDAGYVYVFVRSGSTWTQQAKLSDPTPQTNARFGVSPSLSNNGNVLLIGAAQDNTVDTLAGAAFIFTRTGTTWSSGTSLTNPDLDAVDVFGFATALSGDSSTAAVTSYLNNSPTDDEGSVYIYI